MKIPKIKINDKEYEMKEPSARIWRELTKLDGKPDDVDKFSEVIGIVYGNQGVTADMALDMPISDLMPASLECMTYVNALVNEKLEKIAPNVKPEKAKE